MRAAYFRTTLAIFVAMLAWAQPALAQIIQGTLTGTVSDTSGASMPGVTITVKNEDTGVIYHTSSTGSGVYSMPGLPRSRIRLPPTNPASSACSFRDWGWRRRRPSGRI